MSRAEPCGTSDGLGPGSTRCPKNAEIRGGPGRAAPPGPYKMRIWQVGKAISMREAVADDDARTSQHKGPRPGSVRVGPLPTPSPHHQGPKIASTFRVGRARCPLPAFWEAAREKHNTNSGLDFTSLRGPTVTVCREWRGSASCRRFGVALFGSGAHTCPCGVQGKAIESAKRRSIGSKRC